ncbi:MAG: hypothetical protein AABY64_06620 [Bdellovibrionota bacterium]
MNSVSKKLKRLTYVFLLLALLPIQSFGAEKKSADDTLKCIREKRTGVINELSLQRKALSEELERLSHGPLGFDNGRGAIRREIMGLSIEIVKVENQDQWIKELTSEGMSFENALETTTNPAIFAECSK